MIPKKAANNIYLVTPVSLLYFLAKKNFVLQAERPNNQKPFW